MNYIIKRNKDGWWNISWPKCNDEPSFVSIEYAESYLDRLRSTGWIDRESYWVVVE